MIRSKNSILKTFLFHFLDNVVALFKKFPTLKMITGYWTKKLIETILKY